MGRIRLMLLALTKNSDIMNTTDTRYKMSIKSSMTKRTGNSSRPNISLVLVITLQTIEF
jgi:hypothetical protein